MDCKGYNIKVVEGNEFALLLTLKKRTFTASTPIDEDIDPTALENCVVKVNGVAYTPAIDDQGVTVIMPATLKRTTYNIELTATYQGSAIRAAYFEAFTIVGWNEQSDAQQYIQGSPIVLEPAYVIGGTLTDAELEQLKQEYREKIAAAEEAQEAAEQAKEDFDEKAEALDNLDNVAQQGTNENATLTNTQAAAIAANQYGQTINNKIGEPQSGQPNTLFGAIANINIDTSTIAKQGTNAGATLTATQTAATNAYASAEAAKIGVVDGNDTAVGVAKEIRSEVGTGSDTAAESGTLFAVVKWVKDKVKSIFNLIGSPASGQPSTLFAAIAARGGGGGGDAQESTSQEILANVQSIIDAHIINGVSSDGYVFTDGTVVYGIGAVLAYPSRLVSVTDSHITDLGINIFQANANLQSINLPNLMSIKINFSSCSSLQYVNLPNATSCSTGNLFSQCTSIEEIDLSSVTGNMVIANCCWRCINLKKFNALNAHSLYGVDFFASDEKLIDIITGRNFDGSTNSTALQTWNPTEALRSDIGTLVEPSETFANNLEKLLYNIREHIAANLPDRTGQSALTITFHANIKAAINADTATAQAFSNKNWTIA